MRDLTPSVGDEAQKSMNAPLELYRIYLDGVTLYLADHTEEVKFFDETGNPETYLPFGISRSLIRTDVTAQVDEFNIMLDNVMMEMSAYLGHTDIRGKRCEIVKVFDGLLDDPANSVMMFDGIIDAPVVTEQSMMITVRSRMDTLEVVTPRRRYRRLCNWQFGGAECGVDLLGITVYGSVQTVSSDGRTLTLTGRTEAKNHYADGVLLVGQHEAVVITSDYEAITVDYPFPPSVLGQAYSLRRGCNKTYDESCVGRFNNGRNFGGFLSVPTDRR